MIPCLEPSSGSTRSVSLPTDTARLPSSSPSPQTIFYPTENTRNGTCLVMEEARVCLPLLEAGACKSSATCSASDLLCSNVISQKAQEAGGPYCPGLRLRRGAQQRGEHHSTHVPGAPSPRQPPASPHRACQGQNFGEVAGRALRDVHPTVLCPQQ